jgi:hypothetical protein
MSIGWYAAIKKSNFFLSFYNYMNKQNEEYILMSKKYKGYFVTWEISFMHDRA